MGSSTGTRLDPILADVAERARQRRRIQSLEALRAGAVPDPARGQRFLNGLGVAGRAPIPRVLHAAQLQVRRATAVRQGKDLVGNGIHHDQDGVGVRALPSALHEIDQLLHLQVPGRGWVVHEPQGIGTRCQGLIHVLLAAQAADLDDPRSTHA